MLDLFACYSTNSSIVNKDLEISNDLTADIS